MWEQTLVWNSSLEEQGVERRRYLLFWLLNPVTDPLENLFETELDK